MDNVRARTARAAHTHCPKSSTHTAGCLPVNGHEHTLTHTQKDTHTKRKRVLFFVAGVFVGKRKGGGERRGRNKTSQPNRGQSWSERGGGARSAPPGSARAASEVPKQTYSSAVQRARDTRARTGTAQQRRPRMAARAATRKKRAREREGQQSSTRGCAARSHPSRPIIPPKARVW